MGLKFHRFCDLAVLIIFARTDFREIEENLQNSWHLIPAKNKSLEVNKAVGARSVSYLRQRDTFERDLKFV